MTFNKKIAYFSMEFGLEEHIKTYSGGLGVLAGDYVKAASDLGIDLTGLGLAYHRGYFKQDINNDGRQVEGYPEFEPSKYMKLREEKVDVNVFGEQVRVGAWEYTQKKRNGNGKDIPILFLTTDLPENKYDERKGITAHLYGGNERNRIAQEIVLGKGGTRMLNEMNIKPDIYHLNEGHGAFATLDLRYQFGNTGKKKTVFTTHTPVPAGHDQFNYELAHEALTSDMPWDIKDLAGQDNLNMTKLGLSLSAKVNAVAFEHKLVSQLMFPNENIDHVTNGVHSYTWTSDIMKALYDRYIPQWQNDPRYLSEASKKIPANKYLEARELQRVEFFKQIKQRTGEELDPQKITIGFARRFATYKRADLIFEDMQRLRNIAGEKIQIVFAGKAHPRDEPGKEIIHKINNISKTADNPKTMFVPNYGMTLGKTLTSGVDIWLNTPTRPKEASGTSGMKAAHNGVPHFSTVDGWHFEVEREQTHTKGGWDIGAVPSNFQLRDNRADYKEDSNALYEMLEQQVIPQMNNPLERARIGLEAIENAGFFNSQRQVLDQIKKTYI